MAWSVIPKIFTGIIAKQAAKKGVPKIKDVMSKSSPGGKLVPKKMAGGPGLTKLAGAGYLGSKFAGGGDQQESTLEGGGMGATPAGAGSLFGATPDGMMSGLGLAGGMMGGGGGVQTAPESVSLTPGKSVFEQMLGVLITIKQDTMSLVSSFNSASESQGRAIEAAQAASAEGKTERSRMSLSGVSGTASSVVGGVKKGAGLLGKGFTALFAADVAKRMLTGTGFFDKNAEAAEQESVPVGPDGQPVKEQGFFGEFIDDLKPATNKFMDGIKQVLFAGTPGEFENASAFEGLQKMTSGIGELFDKLLNPITLLEDLFPDTFGGGKLDALKLENIMGYFFGKPGEESPFAKDLSSIWGNVKEAFKYEGSPMEADINKAKEFFTELGANISEKSAQFVTDAKNMRDSIFASVSETFQKIKDFFTFDNIKEVLGFGPDKPLTEQEKTEQQQKQIEEITGEKATEKQREKIIEQQLEDQGIIPDKFASTTKYEDLDEHNKKYVDREVEFQQKKMLKEQELEVPKPKSVPEKNANKTVMGANMVADGNAKAQTSTIMSSHGGQTTNHIDNSKKTNIAQSTSNVEQSAGGGIGTKNDSVYAPPSGNVPAHLM